MVYFNALTQTPHQFLHVFFQKILHKICSISGKVLRIVIFHKNGLQALVEYPLNVLYNFNEADSLSFDRNSLRAEVYLVTLRTST